MPYKDPEKQRAAQQRWYAKQDKTKRVAYNREQRKLRWEVVNQLKMERGCDRCGYSRCSAALEFHHNTGVKNFAVAEGIVACKNIETILAECKLCELICANCHREEHYLTSAMQYNQC
jgi:hypothetical protein